MEKEAIYSRRWLMLALLFLASVLNYMDRQTLSILKPLIKQEFAFTDVHYSGLVAAFMAPYIVMYILGGKMVDKHGSRMCMSLFVGLWSVATMATGFVKNVWQLSVCRFTLGVAEPGNFPGGIRALSLHFSAAQRGVVIGVFSAGSSVGAIVAPPVVAFMATHFGWRSAFLISGGLGMVWVCAWRLVYPAKVERFSTQAGARSTVRDLLKKRELWSLLVARSISDPVWYFYLFWLPGYLQESLGLTLSEAGAVGWAPFLIADLGGVGAGAFSDRLVRSGVEAVTARKRVLMGAALFAPLGILVPHVSHLYCSLAIFSIAGVVCLTWIFNTSTLASDLFRKEDMGTVIGILGAAGATGGLMFNAAIGTVVECLGYAPVFYVAGVLHIAAALVVGLTIRPPHK